MCNLSTAALDAANPGAASRPIPLSAADVTEFGRRFDQVQSGLPRLFAGHWRTWRSNPVDGWACVYDDSGRCVLEFRRVSTAEWIAWLCVAELRALSVRGPTIAAVLRAMGVLEPR